MSQPGSQRWHWRWISGHSYPAPGGRVVRLLVLTLLVSVVLALNVPQLSDEEAEKLYPAVTAEEPPGLFDLVSQRAHEATNTVMVTSVTKEYLRMWENWRCSLAPHAFHNYIVYAGDIESLRILRARGEPVFAPIALEEQWAAEEDEADGASAAADPGPAEDDGKGRRLLSTVAATRRRKGRRRRNHRRSRQWPDEGRDEDDPSAVVPQGPLPGDGSVSAVQASESGERRKDKHRLKRRLATQTQTASSSSPSSASAGMTPASGPANFGTLGFEELMLARLLHVNLILAWGVNVYVNDCDTVWLRNPLLFYPSRLRADDLPPPPVDPPAPEAFLPALQVAPAAATPAWTREGIDVLAQDEQSHNPRSPAHVCTGNVLVVASPRAKIVWFGVVDELRRVIEAAKSGQLPSSPLSPPLLPRLPHRRGPSLSVDGGHHAERAGHPTHRHPAPTQRGHCGLCRQGHWRDRIPSPRLPRLALRCSWSRGRSGFKCNPGPVVSPRSGDGFGRPVLLARVVLGA